MARAATAAELTKYRTPGKWSKWRAAVFQPTTIYTARVNQSFSSYDSLLEITYDAGSGTLSDVKADMTLLVGSSAGAHDKGITRVKSIDGTKIYIGETSDIEFADNDYLTIIDDFGLWARHVLLSSSTPYMDGTIAYSDQHASPDPTPIMGSHRVLKLTGADVSADFDASASYVIGALSTITGYAWVAPGSSASSGMNTATPTITWNSVGWKKVYLTITAANGKTFLGVRYVYIWNDANLPPRAQINSARADVETGGWSFDLTLFGNCTLTDIRDHALVIVFAEDYFGTTQQNIGPVAGSENVEMIGWIAKQTIDWNPEQGNVRFTAYGAHYWFSQIPSFPDGVEFVTGTPAAWTEFQNLTLDKGLWHMLHWRTTATRIMDVFLTGDTKYTREVSSLASNLWEQIREMAFLQIFARAGVNAHGQLYIEPHPQLVAAASRTWPTVMTITKEDWQGEIVFERVSKPEVAVVSLSGVLVNASGVGTPYFSLSPGHAYPHYGAIDVQDKLLVSGQSDANQKAGLYRGWQNNPYPEIPVPFAADIRLIDCFPRQKCAIAIAAGDTERGLTYSGDLLPISINLVTDPSTGYTHREVVFEAVTDEDISVNGDIPGSRADVSIPPTLPSPSLPVTPPFILPGVVEPTAGFPKTLLIRDENLGLLYTTDYNVSPHWIFFGAGLTTAQKQGINFFFRTPNGACYCGMLAIGSPPSDMFVARAPFLGGTWIVLYDINNLQTLGGNWGVRGAAYHPLQPETVGLILYKDSDGGPYFYIGANTSFTKGVSMGADPQRRLLSYGNGYWMANGNNFVQLVAADGMSIYATRSADGSLGDDYHVRVGTTGKTYHSRFVGLGIYIGADNLNSYVINTDTDIHFGPDGEHENSYFAVDPTGLYCMTRYGTGERGRSSDGGSSWGAIANLPFQDNYFFAYAGGAGINSRWLAVGGTEIYYSEDFGDSWVSRRGNLLTFIPVPALDMIRVLEY